MLEPKELGICVLEYEFPESIAKGIIVMVDQLGEDIWNPSPVGNTGEVTQYRTSTSFNLADKLPIWDTEVRKYFTEAINDYCKKYSVEVTQDEGFQLLRYRSSNEYKFHADGSWAMYRNVSALVYLNPSEYEGGETFFENQNLHVKPSKPSIVVFPSNYAYRHAALPVTSGEKFVLVTWMNDMPIGFHSEIMYNIAKLTNRI